jgi:hypothetical protein
MAEFLHQLLDSWERASLEGRANEKLIQKLCIKPGASGSGL